jgi:hypothetical protein
MNKDLAGISAVWRALFGVRRRPLVLPVCMLSKSHRSWFLRRMMCPSLETDAIFDTALSGNYCKRRACVSVMAVQEKCDEYKKNAMKKDRGVRLGKGYARHGRGIPPFSQSARKGWGTRIFKLRRLVAPGSRPHGLRKHCQPFQSQGSGYSCYSCCTQIRSRSAC